MNAVWYLLSWHYQEPYDLDFKLSSNLNKNIAQVHLSYMEAKYIIYWQNTRTTRLKTGGFSRELLDYKLADFHENYETKNWRFSKHENY